MVSDTARLQVQIRLINRHNKAKQKDVQNACLHVSLWPPGGTKAELGRRRSKDPNISTVWRLGKQWCNGAVIASPAATLWPQNEWDTQDLLWEINRLFKPVCCPFIEPVRSEKVNLLLLFIAGGCSLPYF